MQIAWIQRTLREENSLGRVSRSRPDLVISQAVVPFASPGPGAAVPVLRLPRLPAASHAMMVPGGFPGRAEPNQPLW